MSAFITTTGRQIVYAPPATAVEEPTCVTNPACDCGIPLDPNLTATLETRRVHFPPGTQILARWCEVNEICCTAGGSQISVGCPSVLCGNCQVCTTLTASFVCSGCSGTITLTFNGTNWTGSGTICGSAVTLILTCTASHGGTLLLGLIVNCRGNIIPGTFVFQCTPFNVTWTQTGTHVGCGLSGCVLTIAPVGDASGSGNTPGTITTIQQKVRVQLPPGWSLGPDGCVDGDCTNTCVPPITIPCCPGKTLPAELYLVLVSVIGSNGGNCAIVNGVVVPLDYQGTSLGIANYSCPNGALIIGKSICDQGGALQTTVWEGLTFTLTVCSPTTSDGTYILTLTVIRDFYSGCTTEAALPFWTIFTFPPTGYPCQQVGDAGIAWTFVWRIPCNQTPLFLQQTQTTGFTTDGSPVGGACSISESPAFCLYPVLANSPNNVTAQVILTQ